MSNPPILSHLSPIYANIALQASITVLLSLILPQIDVQSHWNLSTRIYMVLFQSKLLTNCYNLCVFFHSLLVFLSCDVPVTSLTLPLTILLSLTVILVSGKFLCCI